MKKGRSRPKRNQPKALGRKRLLRKLLRRQSTYGTLGAAFLRRLMSTASRILKGNTVRSYSTAHLSEPRQANCVRWE